MLTLAPLNCTLLTVGAPACVPGCADPFTHCPLARIWKEETSCTTLREPPFVIVMQGCSKFCTFVFTVSPPGQDPLPLEPPEPPELALGELLPLPVFDGPPVLVPGREHAASRRLPSVRMASTRNKTRNCLLLIIPYLSNPDDTLKYTSSLMRTAKPRHKRFPPRRI